MQNHFKPVTVLNNRKGLWVRFIVTRVDICGVARGDALLGRWSHLILHDTCANVLRSRCVVSTILKLKYSKPVFVYPTFSPIQTEPFSHESYHDYFQAVQLSSHANGYVILVWCEGLGRQYDELVLLVLMKQSASWTPKLHAHYVFLRKLSLEGKCANKETHIVL